MDRQTLGTLVVIAGMASLAFSAAFDWGFFGRLGMTPFAAPKSFLDDLESWLTRLPVVLALSALALFALCARRGPVAAASEGVARPGGWNVTFRVTVPRIAVFVTAGVVVAFLLGYGAGYRSQAGAPTHSIQVGDAGNERTYEEARLVGIYKRWIVFLDPDGRYVWVNRNQDVVLEPLDG